MSTSEEEARSRTRKKWQTKRWSINGERILPETPPTGESTEGPEVTKAAVGGPTIADQCDQTSAVPNPSSPVKHDEMKEKKCHEKKKGRVLPKQEPLREKKKTP